MEVMPRHFFIQTVGCQMNILDSELIAAELLRAGHEQVDAIGRADTILLNTCSVRQHAEDKIYSLLGRLKEIKQQRPELLIAVLGCMAQKDRHEIFRRAPCVDLVVGPGQLTQLPALIEQVAAGGGPQLQISLDRIGADRASVERSFVQFAPDRTAVRRPAPHQAMVRIMFGCDRFCTYCIVPRVRGPEQSRPAAEIIEEVRRLAANGCLEVTLLGQTVNSYRDATGTGTVELADLLYMLHEIDGIRRLRFVTNHPKHMTPALLEAMRDLPKVSPYLHLPAQSGSNAILERMKRGYTVEFYREMLARVHEMLPHIAVTSDFIVGFCGESEEDFRQTAELVRDGRFKNSFIFKYSGRPGTKADEFYVDDVPEATKRRRNNELLAIQNAISLEDNQPLLGRTVEILVEGPSKVAKKRGSRKQISDIEISNLEISNLEIIEDPRADGPHPDLFPTAAGTTQLVGRTTCDRIVVFEGSTELIGRILPITIEKIDAFTLFGRVAVDGNQH
jgi:tRNA-2-methylthio-N6-dimethylallyladenosine synthase